MTQTRCPVCQHTLFRVGLLWVGISFPPVTCDSSSCKYFKHQGQEILPAFLPAILSLEMASVPSSRLSLFSDLCVCVSVDMSRPLLPFYTELSHLCCFAS